LVDADDDTIQGGLSIPMTAAFIIAEIAGSGILALPNALAGTQWTGIGLLIVLGLLVIYCGVMLGINVGILFVRDRCLKEN